MKVCFFCHGLEDTTLAEGKAYDCEVSKLLCGLCLLCAVTTHGLKIGIVHVAKGGGSGTKALDRRTSTAESSF